MSIENKALFESMMHKMEDEFPGCLRVHVDWDFILKDKITHEIKSKKKFRVLAIQNDVEHYQHLAIIISKLGHEYVQLPDHIKKFLLELSKKAEIGTHLDFTGNIYLYTDKLIIPEDLVQKHFQENNLILFIRDQKYWQKISLDL